MTYSILKQLQCHHPNPFVYLSLLLLRGRTFKKKKKKGLNNNVAWCTAEQKQHKCVRMLVVQLASIPLKNAI